MTRRRWRARVLLVSLCLALSGEAWAEDGSVAALPLWELGLGMGGFSMPQYMGSDERYTYPFVFPYPIYRGKRWWLDRSGLRGRLLRSNRWSLDISFSGGLPVKNSNQARQGMPTLYLTGEAGPRLNWIFWHEGANDLRVMLPWRAALDIKGHFLGTLSEPSVQYIHQRPWNQGWLRWKLELGLLYASRRYHDTYYTVAPLYARAARPTYQARAGLHSGFAHASLRYPLSRDWQCFVSARVRDLGMGVVKDSPLVRNKIYATMAAGMIWMFARSEQSASGEE